MNLKERWRILLIVITTLIILGGSFSVYQFVEKSIDERRSRELNNTLEDIGLGIEEKFKTGAGILYDLRGMLTIADLNADMWAKFLLAMELEARYPNIYSLAYVQRVPKGDIRAFEESMRRTEGEKYKNYMVFPVSDNAESFPIKYLHTKDPDLAVLLGFDFRYSERTISAFTEAVLGDKPALSELAHLDLIIPESKKTGYEIVLPVYSNPAIKDLLLEDRRRFLVGFVGAWIAPESLKANISDLGGLKYSIYDGNQQVISSGKIGDVRASISKELTILNRNFKITLETDKSYQLPYFEEKLSLITALGIVLVNLLWFLTVYSFATSRKQALELAALATKDLRKFKQAVDGVSDHVVITDPEGVITYANKAATMITGYSLQEMIGKRPSLWGGQMPKEFYQNFWKTIKYDKKPFWGELMNRRKSGELYESELRVSPILDDNGNLMFFVGIERDLSRFRAIEKMKTEFLSLASHQLRTPLSAVKWFSEMLKGGDAGKLTKMQERYVSKIYESNEREIQLVNALLNVSRIESGKIVVLPKPTDLRMMVEDILAETKTNLVGEDKVLQYTIDKNVPEVEIDADLIKHVYSNLLSNATKYTKGGGKIDVKIYLKGNKIITEVKDNGIGIPKAEQPRLFEKFFRASNATKKETEGSGLGLYLTKTIVESSGGKIWFTSEEGKGSTFKFSIPVKIGKIQKKPAG